MTRMTASKARGKFSDLLSRVAKRHERIVVHRRGKDVAALVPVEDLALLEELQDRRDAREAKRRLADPAEVPIPYEQARKELGLD
ncbi:MAG: hypothetical protein A3H28_15740 [Acidobacteria bacterium RIFCSPLOWO2_02_FULL_61_28]|nr:MAG: hypothetical protein A3H28_15740 [Acidobacteria bacterium RIFCSPLOWO2_02_FULL_61_28]